MSNQASNNSLLVEFLTEELPPVNLETSIGKSFSDALFSQLNGFVNDNSKLNYFVAPRRFGCVIENIQISQQQSQQLKRGPAVNTGLKDGMPTPALLGFAKSCGTEWDKLEKRDDGYFYYQAIIEGKSLDGVINDAINNAIKKIPIAKAMRWGNTDYQFIRPVHNLIVMLNQQVLPVECLGLSSVNSTIGHRFMSGGRIEISSAQSYFMQLYEAGKVVSSFVARRELINYNLSAKAKQLGLTINHIDGLLDEVTALVEWPEVLVGSFDEKFLKVPQECLILSMAKNQKYFALLDSNGKLSNKFLFVANLVSKDPQVIIEGNQKVLSARLADAEFFYEFDKRTPLKDFVSRTKNVVYHNKLGSQFERIARLQKIAGQIAPMLGVDPELARHTAYLLKADLVTEMVGEFPELQGVMGKYYALTSNESNEVANAIEKHYYPRFSGDLLPDSDLATVVSLADKLECLTGIWGIGLIPTGDKDPYALRRAALGVVRVLLSKELDLQKLLELAFCSFDEGKLAENTVSELYKFILSRLANFLTSVEGYSTKVVNAVINSIQFELATTGTKKFNYLPGLLSSLNKFALDPINQPLLEANKRIENILRKNQEHLQSNQVSQKLLQDSAEITLYSLFLDKFVNEDSLSVQNNAEKDWLAYFTKLAEFNQPLANFFDNVMVMADDLELRNNRLNLLNQLYRNFNQVCKLSELA